MLTESANVFRPSRCTVRAGAGLLLSSRLTVAQFRHWPGLQGNGLAISGQTRINVRMGIAVGYGFWARATCRFISGMARFTVSPEFWGVLLLYHSAPPCAPSPNAQAHNSDCPVAAPVRRAETPAKGAPAAAPPRLLKTVLALTQRRRRRRRRHSRCMDWGHLMGKPHNYTCMGCRCSFGQASTQKTIAMQDWISELARQQTRPGTSLCEGG